MAFVRSLLPESHDQTATLACPNGSGQWAHVLERTGLALMGASCGLFVAAHVGRADIDLLGSSGAVLAMMLYGALGFYVGIDFPAGSSGIA